MAYPTQPAFVHHGDWSDIKREHPALKWMEYYTKDVVDARAWDLPASAHHTPDYTLQKSSGEEVSGADAAWKAYAESYAPFSSYWHEPRFCIVWEDDEEGWVMFGVATLWYNLAASGEGGGLKDKEGRSWDGATPGAFKFYYIPDAEAKGGIKLRRTEMYSDPSTAMGLMMKRGMLKE